MRVGELCATLAFLIQGDPKVVLEPEPDQEPDQEPDAAPWPAVTLSSEARRMVREGEPDGPAQPKPEPFIPRSQRVLQGSAAWRAQHGKV
jgi:hypothetical protein